MNSTKMHESVQKEVRIRMREDPVSSPTRRKSLEVKMGKKMN